MINADKFKSIFGLYATELWSMPEKDFLKWLNSEVMNCSEIPNNSDTISRQAAIEVADAVWMVTGDKNVAKVWNQLRNLPLAQPESTADAEFWRKRADYYSDMCSKLIADMGAGVKIEAVKIDETGITFTKKKPPTQPEQEILSWLLAYHTKSFELHGRYMPHEVIGWLVHDFANAYMAERREE